MTGSETSLIAIYPLCYVCIYCSRVGTSSALQESLDSHPKIMSGIFEAMRVVNDFLALML